MNESGPLRPATGSQPRPTAKIATRMTPTRKSGMELSTTLVPVKASSVFRPLPRRVRIAMTTPSGTATTTPGGRRGRRVAASPAVAARSSPRRAGPRSSTCRISGQHAFDVAPVLHDQGVVQPEGLGLGCHEFRGRGGAERRAHRVTRDEVDHQEGCRHQHPQ